MRILMFKVVSLHRVQGKTGLRELFLSEQNTEYTSGICLVDTEP